MLNQTINRQWQLWDLAYGESKKLLKHSFAHIILIEINRERNQFKMPDF